MSDDGEEEAGASTSTPTLVEEVLSSLPKTDKQIRHEKRVKLMERRERKAEKRRRASDPEGEGWGWGWGWVGMGFWLGP